MEPVVIPPVEPNRCPRCEERLGRTGELYHFDWGSMALDNEYYEVLRCPLGHGDFFFAAGVLVPVPPD